MYCKLLAVHTVKYYEYIIKYLETHALSTALPKPRNI